MPKSKWVFKPSEEVEPFHYYASSIAHWQVMADPEALIRHMKRDPYPFQVWRVPLPIEADYQINFYVPQVEGLVYIGFYARS